MAAGDAAVAGGSRKERDLKLSMQRIEKASAHTARSQEIMMSH